jgi:MFS family permease
MRSSQSISLASKRGRHLVYLEAFWALGALIAAGLAWLIMPWMGWRPLPAILALPGLIAARPLRAAGDDLPAVL